MNWTPLIMTIPFALAIVPFGLLLCAFTSPLGVIPSTLCTIGVFLPIVWIEAKYIVKRWGDPFVPG
jgi:hypothetical protein